jgi:lipoprotein-anchoring transpeptidase ErfK/SrfK
MMKVSRGLAGALAALSVWSVEASADMEQAATEPEATVRPTESTAAEPPGKPEVPAPPPKPVITLLIDIDLAKQQLTVKTGGAVRHTWPVSSGTQEFPTPRGAFRPQWMAKLWHSRKYDDAPMPHSIFFNEGVAIHATTATGRLGRPASHGCVRLSPANAATLFALVTRHGMAATRIVVHGQPRYHEPQVAARRDHDPQPRIQLARAAYAPFGYSPAYGYGRPYAYVPPRAVYPPPFHSYSAVRPMQPRHARYPLPYVLRY